MFFISHNITTYNSTLDSPLFISNFVGHGNLSDKVFIGYDQYSDSGLNKIGLRTKTINSGYDIDIVGEVLVEGGTTISGLLTVQQDFELASDKSYYIGDIGTDGTWRFTRSGSDMLVQRRESGVYVTKSTILA